MRAVTRFINLPSVTDGSAPAIFATINDCLVRQGLKYEHLICFNSDTCNTMKGKRNGVVRHLQDQQPDMFHLGCICHLENQQIHHNTGIVSNFADFLKMLRSNVMA